ncbi:MAG: hypothetical protein DRQ51_10125 [Gammaproteobacteria bacterium]|nr:MAG: hypothetical protein DRQ51_10125 [Gammaproteobacteria bacterium]
MDTMTIDKSQLKDLIKTSIREILKEEQIIANYPFASDKEMKEIESLHCPNPVKNTQYIRL